MSKKEKQFDIPKGNLILGIFNGVLIEIAVFLLIFLIIKII